MNNAESELARYWYDKGFYDALRGEKEMKIKKLEEKRTNTGVEYPNNKQLMIKINELIEENKAIHKKIDELERRLDESFINPISYD